MTRRVVPIGILAGLAILVAPSVSSARTFSVRIDPAVQKTPAGRALLLTGRYLCEPGAKLTIKLTVLQAGLGALARGTFKGTCTGTLQRLAFKAAVSGKRPVAFGAGFAKACSVATARQGRKYIGLRAWCNGLTLK